MAEYKVGDELVFDVDGKLYIEKITHITKTGRMKVTMFSFQVLPDLTLYGNARTLWRPHYKCLGKPTDAHRKKIIRQNKIGEVLSLVRPLMMLILDDSTLNINGISDETLDELSKILTEHEQRKKERAK